MKSNLLRLYFPRLYWNRKQNISILYYSTQYYSQMFFLYFGKCLPKSHKNKKKCSIYFYYGTAYTTMMADALSAHLTFIKTRTHIRIFKIHFNCMFRMRCDTPHTHNQKSLFILMKISSKTCIILLICMTLLLSKGFITFWPKFSGLRKCF